MDFNTQDAKHESYQAFLQQKRFLILGKSSSK